MKIQSIHNLIYEIRGFKVMLDFDLARIYGVETKRLKEAVRRNANRFPKDFMFILNKAEYNSLRTQIATLNSGRGAHSKYLPFAFTEHGITMLASILNSDKAIKMNISIVRAFVQLRQLAIHQKDLAVQFEKLKMELGNRIDEHDVQLNAIYEAIENLLDDQAEQKTWESRERIGFKK